MNLLGGADHRTLTEFMGSRTDFHRFHRFMADPIAGAMTENLQYVLQAQRLRPLAEAFAGGDHAEILSALMAFPRKGQTAAQTRKMYADSLIGKNENDLAAKANELMSHIVFLEGNEIPEWVATLRDVTKGQNGKFIEDAIRVATQAPPGGVLPGDVSGGRNGNGPGNVVVVTTGDQKKETSAGWKGLGD